MSSSTPRRLREFVSERANGRCEYCQALAIVTGQVFHAEHIQPIAKGGLTIESNLCLACSTCNQVKGARVNGVDRVTGQITQLFNPRTQEWKTHFRWIEDGIKVEGLTATGRATIDLLGLNRGIYKSGRVLWTQIGIHPPD